MLMALAIFTRCMFFLFGWSSIDKSGSSGDIWFRLEDVFPPELVTDLAV